MGDKTYKILKTTHGVPKKEMKLDQVAVFQTGMMRYDYFERYKDQKTKSIIGETSPAHMIFGDDYGDYGYDENFDYDYGYDEYHDYDAYDDDYYVDDYDDEGYDEYDDYSLYEQAAVNLKRAREEFRVAQQLMKWKGRGDSRLLRRY